MPYTRLNRLLASLCALGSVLCLAVSAPILFTWAIDSSRPVSMAPLLLGAGLVLTAGIFFVLRRRISSLG
jgi:hypothetical protein